MRKTIRVRAGDGYDFIIGDNLLPDISNMTSSVVNAGTVALFTDSNVAPLFADRVEEQLRRGRFRTCRFVFEAGEKSKNIETVARFLDFMSENNMTRGDAVAVLGGGVAGDMGGFAASIYLRGIKFMQMPTTVLAAVDSSVGGKTAVNTRYGKNLTGTFWQPSLVLCDTTTFDQLSEDQILDGYAEVIKSAAIRGARIFEDLEAGKFRTDMADIIARCVNIKSDVVHEDERESGLRRILNFGHTMAHAIELKSGFGISHGKAVAIGMLMVTRASEARGLSEKGTYERLYDLIKGAGYRTETDIPLEELCDAARHDKKASGDSINLAYIDRIGSAKIRKVKLDDLYDFYNV